MLLGAERTLKLIRVGPRRRFPRMHDAALERLYSGSSFREAPVAFRKTEK